jgi:hypothetical protein
MIRATTMDIAFRHPFALKGLGSAVPPGTCRIDIEEEQIDGLSFPAYRRLATFIRVPVAGRSGWSQDLLVDPKELERALARDSAADATAV